MSSKEPKKVRMGKKRTRLEVGDSVFGGKYKIVKIIAERGMANVYAAIDSSLGVLVCIKEIRKSEAGKRDIEYISLLQEANILGKLRYESIPRVTEMVEDGDSLIFAMDFLDGITLYKLVKDKGKIAEGKAVKWMIQIVEIMEFLHSDRKNKKPILYRDMKPENLMVRTSGNINLFDFGISIEVKDKEQKPEYTLGTSGYVPREQQNKHLPVDLRSDIFAMGRTFYFMLTGVDIRSLMNPDEKYLSSKDVKPIEEWSPEISPALIAIVNKCMADDPNDRFQSCEELHYALETYQFSDEKNKLSAYKKVISTLTTFLAGVLVMCGSLIPFKLNEDIKQEEYKEAIALAEQSGLVEDYYKALNLDPMNIQAYLGYAEAAEVDGLFSKGEERLLLEFINPNILDLKELDGYGELAYRLGRLYWFYYDDYNEQEEGKVLSVKWFNDAINKGYNVKESSIYYDLGIFERDIAKSIKDSSDAGMYKAYWDNLLKAQEEASNDVVTMQIYISVSECISVYSYNLKKDGVSYEEAMKEVKVLQYFVDNYAIEGSSEVISSLYKELSKTVSTLESKVNTVYGRSGGDE